MIRSFDHYSQWPDNEWPWKNFSPREMASKGEGALKLNTVAMDRLQELRDRLGAPLLITSAYRSPAHNRRVGGASSSYHLRGEAFDVRMENHDPHHFENVARDVGFTGFGFYPKSGFMHIDIGPAREWGNRWPASATTLPIEPKIQPERLREDRAAAAVAGATGSGIAATAIGNIPAVSGLLGSLAPVAQTVALVLVAALIAYFFWRRTR